MNEINNEPPGKPGSPPCWTPSAKDGVGTSATLQSRVWFTISHGIIDEVYYPNTDQANVKNLQFLVTDKSDFFSDEQRDSIHEISWIAEGIPGFQVTNTCKQGRYRIAKTVIADPKIDVLLQKIKFSPLQKKLEDYECCVLFSPHINNQGYGNNGWVGNYKGTPMLFAEREGTTLALGCSIPFIGMSCGYVGTSDGWQDLSRHKQMTWFYPAASDGNIALTGRTDLISSKGELVVALAFGRNAAEAGQRVRRGLFKDFGYILNDYVAGWKNIQTKFIELESRPDGKGLYRVSTAVLKTHEAKRFPGGIIASLSIPWGSNKGDYDLGGYHLVWNRDLVEAATALLAAGNAQDARNTLEYLMSTQESDGHWPQNMWLNGLPYWGGVQMDEAAFPILLADKLAKKDELGEINPWSMVRKAASFIVCNGPVTQQDRWEDDGGYSPFTLAVEVAALLAAADFAEINNDDDIALYLRQTADIWNSNIERWIYVTNTPLSNQFNVPGYYVRIAPPEVAEASSPKGGFVPIKNRPPNVAKEKATQIVSPDALALVRFGLRSPDDPRIIHTVRIIDALLRTESSTGPVWHRYTLDGYGEHADGRPFDGTGVGRGWPLLAGERAHYELSKGNREEAERLLHVIEAQTSSGGLMPEQVWDSDDIEEYELFNGHPSGSAMPLVWAHAEYIKLLRSLRDRAVFDMPQQTTKRYQRNQVSSKLTFWRFNHKVRSIPAGKNLRIETLAPATIHWSFDEWQSVNDTKTVDSQLGIHYADLVTENLDSRRILFTFYWPQFSKWENVNFAIEIEE